MTPEKPNDLYWKTRCAEAEEALAEKENQIKALMEESDRLEDKLNKQIAEKDKEIAALRKENYELMFHPVIEQKVEKALSAERGRLIKEIDASVAGCNEMVTNEKWKRHSSQHLIMLCKHLPPEQKCEGCKRLLKFKKERLE